MGQAKSSEVAVVAGGKTRNKQDDSKPPDIPQMMALTETVCKRNHAIFYGCGAQDTVMPRLQEMLGHDVAEFWMPQKHGEDQLYQALFATTRMHTCHPGFMKRVRFFVDSLVMQSKQPTPADCNSPRTPLASRLLVTNHNTHEVSRNRRSTPTSTFQAPSQVLAVPGPSPMARETLLVTTSVFDGFNDVTTSRCRLPLRRKPEFESLANCLYFTLCCLPRPEDARDPCWQQWCALFVMSCTSVYESYRTYGPH